MAAIADHDAYIAAAPEPCRPSLERLRAILVHALPGAEEIAAAGLKATKTGITFSPRRPIPDDLVERLARASRKDA
jgi:hypothetical protein